HRHGSSFLLGPGPSGPRRAALVGAPRVGEVLGQRRVDAREGRRELDVVLAPVSVQPLEALGGTPLPGSEQHLHLAVELLQLALHLWHEGLDLRDRGGHRLLVYERLGHRAVPPFRGSDRLPGGSDCSPIGGALSVTRNLGRYKAKGRTMGVLLRPGRGRTGRRVRTGPGRRPRGGSAPGWRGARGCRVAAAAGAKDRSAPW